MIRTAMMVAILTASVSAYAEGEDSLGGSEPEDSPGWLAVSFSPLRAVEAPMFEVTSEVKLAPKMATGLILGVGPTNVDYRDMAGNFSTDGALCMVGAGLFRYYAYGTFERGAFVGAEAHYIYIDRNFDTSVQRDLEGFITGPSIGGKYTFDFGLTVFGSMLFGVHVYQPRGIDPDELPGDPSAKGTPTLGPILLGPNLDVGWMF